MNDNNTSNIYESIRENAKPSAQRTSRKSLQVEFDKECSRNKDRSVQPSRPGLAWCEGFSINMASVNTKQALTKGAEKITQTFNNVRTTFGTLSQKLRKSTRRRQPLHNIDSPQTPITPYTRSRHVLGRTPTKMYSPFGIDTPVGKENHTPTSSGRRPSPCKAGTSLQRKLRGQKDKLCVPVSQSSYSPHMKFEADIEQTQIGIYEFQSTANRIIRRSMKE